LLLLLLLLMLLLLLLLAPAPLGPAPSKKTMMPMLTEQQTREMEVMRATKDGCCCHGSCRHFLRQKMRMGPTAGMRWGERSWTMALMKTGKRRTRKTCGRAHAPSSVY
jgi:hypothetical protein